MWVLTALIFIATQNAAGLKAKADSLLAQGKFQLASEMYFKSADAFDKKGDPNAAKVLRERAQRYQTTVEIYEAIPAQSQSLARGEPISGMYLGANIEREEATRDAQAFNNLIQKRHAMFFMYRRYGVAFPMALAKKLKDARASLQIAWEPDSLSNVQDNSYLRTFAEDIRKSEIPVFVRFASEMNGSWVPYHGDPETYIQKFRLVSQIIRNTAPNAIMVWSPNCIPEQPIPSYYPGAEFVDWVGVNFYSVMYNDADRAREASWRFPTDSIDFVYKRYSSKHPIMISEWAASHRSILDDFDKPDFAARKIKEFFSTVPLKYPRLKAASWLSFNALKYAKYDRQLNNYSLFDNDLVAKSYSIAIQEPYFLSQIGSSFGLQYQKVNASKVKPGAKVKIFLRSYDPDATVQINGKGSYKLGSEVELSSAIKSINVIGKSGKPILIQTINQLK